MVTYFIYSRALTGSSELVGIVARSAGYRVNPRDLTLAMSRSHVGLLDGRTRS
jgi:hypothetical protein